MPHFKFVEMCNDLSQEGAFLQWTSIDAVGESRAELSLLLLGALKYLGRSWTFDCLEEANGLSSETNRVFFNKFIEYGDNKLYKRYVLGPASKINLLTHGEIYATAGFNGCLGSTDGSHVAMLNCPSWASIAHKGPKQSFPCRTFNTTVGHTRQILGTTSGHPSTWNDKTVVLFDELLTKFKETKLSPDYQFKLLEYDNLKNVIEVIYHGAWFIVDNGYLNWSCTIPPMKNPTTYKFVCFSEWLESMRKDVEEVDLGY